MRLVCYRETRLVYRLEVAAHEDRKLAYSTEAGVSSSLHIHTTQYIHTSLHTYTHITSKQILTSLGRHHTCPSGLLGGPSPHQKEGMSKAEHSNTPTSTRRHPDKHASYTSTPTTKDNNTIRYNTIRYNTKQNLHISVVLPSKKHRR
jgi:hypothetical protein